MTSRADKRTAESWLIDRVDGLIALGLGLLSLAAYVRTLVPGLIPKDSAEFQTLAFMLDHAHTTGYEVYIILAKLFTLLPIQDVAYRVNLFSACMGALTVALVYLAGKTLSHSRWAGALGALALAVSSTFWSQAIIAEVYTPGAAFTAAILLLGLLWHASGRSHLLFAAGLLGGLSVGIHGSVLLLAPAVLVILLLRGPGLGLPVLRRVWAPALAGAVVGGLLFLAIFAVVDFRESPASMMNTAYIPSISRWEMAPEELDSFGERLNFLVFARQWRSAMFADPDRVIPRNLQVFDRFYAQDFSFPVQILVLMGFIALFARRWRLGVFFLVAVAFHLYYTLNYRIGDIYVFFLSLYVYFAVLAAEGSGMIFRGLRHLPGLWPRLAAPALALLLFYLALSPHLGHRLEILAAGEARWEFMELASNRSLETWRQTIRQSVQALPENAVVLMDWNSLYGYFYVAYVEQGRKDLAFHEAYPYANTDGMADTLLSAVRENLNNGRPVFMLDEYEEIRRGGLDYSLSRLGGTTLYRIELR